MIPSAMKIIRQVSTPALDDNFSDEWKIEMGLKAYVALHRYNIVPRELFRGFFESLWYEDWHSWSRSSNLYSEMVKLSDVLIKHIHRVRPRLWEKLGFDQINQEIQATSVSTPFSRYLVCDFVVYD